MPGAQLGRSVAVSGDTVVAGAIGDKVAGVQVGSAYVFVRPGGGWTGSLTQAAKLTASDAAGAPISFGGSVAVSSDTVVVGATGDFNAFDSGSAYVFVEPVGGWTGSLTEDAKLTASDAAERDLFGFSVAVSGDTVVVGARGDDDVDLSTGSAYVFGLELTVEEAIQALTADLEELVTNGTLKNREGNQLVLKFEAAQRQLDEGHDAAAIGQLNAFINQINAFITSGKLTVSEGQPLIDATNATIDQVLFG